jgi:hypothetical protein
VYGSQGEGGTVKTPELALNAAGTQLTLPMQSKYLLLLMREDLLPGGMMRPPAPALKNFYTAGLIPA